MEILEGVFSKTSIKADASTTITADLALLELLGPPKLWGSLMSGWQAVPEFRRLWVAPQYGGLRSEGNRTTTFRRALPAL